MRTRLISAAVLVPVVVILFWLGNPWLTLGIALVATLAAWEVATLVTSAGLPANRMLVVAAPLIAAGVAWSGSFLFSWGSWAVVTGAALWVVIAAVDGVRHVEARVGFLAWAGTVLASFYVSMLAFAIGILLFSERISSFDAQPHLPIGLDQGRFWLLVLVLSVWALDSAAYVFGKYFPRGRFMNHISPNKTWSGAIGGGITAIVVTTALVVAGGFNPIAGLAIGAVIAVTAQAGDLAESTIKRAAGAKDSGNLIPGHGGVLDRVDSFVFAAPAVYATVLVLVLNQVVRL